MSKSTKETENAELVGGLYEEQGQFGWWVAIRMSGGVRSEKLSSRLYATEKKAEAALDREIAKISREFSRQGASILSKDGKLYA